MKKIALIVCFLVICVAAGRAQESRQDVSISGTVLIEPFIASPTDTDVSANRAFGALASYRFMLTPNSAVEANYGVTYANEIHYVISNTNHYLVNTRTQEISFAYVRSFTFRKFNPFVEAGAGGLIFLPIVNTGLTTLDAHQETKSAALYGAGLAYEISPSFDIRAEYRGLVTKVPNFKDSFNQLNTNKWYNIYDPVIGVAYHF
ncbi:MAG: outer membrane beta-barrel protein [Terracidiphilus sp.]|jgi:outer membrane immunogenic protein